MADMKILAEEMLGTSLEELTDRERRVLEKLAQRRRISRNINRLAEEDSSFGERVADRVAEFGGSWTFIGLFGFMLFIWIGGNLLLVLAKQHAYDPYPFIFLNLILSMLAAVQAPVIMMSQNRQSDKDRLAAGHDYEVNLKAELEILQLHEKLDDVRQNQLAVVMEQQSRQLAKIEELLAAGRSS